MPKAWPARPRADDHVALVVVDEAPGQERIVGYSWIDSVDCRDPIPMLGIGIIDEFHEAGIGKIFLNLMIERARGLDLDRIKLGVFADNARAIHVYESVGFRTVPEIPPADVDGRTEIYMVVTTA